MYVNCIPMIGDCIISSAIELLAQSWTCLSLSFQKAAAAATNHIPMEHPTFRSRTLIWNFLKYCLGFWMKRHKL